VKTPRLTSPALVEDLGRFVQIIAPLIPGHAQFVVREVGRVLELGPGLYRSARGTWHLLRLGTGSVAARWSGAKQS
jgi:hypothetical protein